jgi:hypothetical protein
VSNRGIGRAKMFLGGMVLFAAAVLWFTGTSLSPLSDNAADGGIEIRRSVVTLMRNSAIGALGLSVLAAWLLFPARRPRKPWRDWTLIAAIGLLVAASLYRLVWLVTALR